MNRTHLVRAFTGGMAITILSACASVPIPLDVDLKAKIPEASEGTVSEPVQAGDDVFQPSHTLGPVFTVDLDRTTTRLAGAAVLNPTQLEAVNDRLVCWGVEVTGEGVAALEDGTITVGYSVKKLMLRITFSVL